MDTRVIPWTIEISDIETQLRVGIWDHEREFQPIRINLSLRAIASVFPQSIDDCLNYQPICRWITEEWPKQPHTPLLETKLRELMCFIFDFDARVEWLDIALSKPKAISDARGVGIRMALSRDDFEAAFRAQESCGNLAYRYQSQASISICTPAHVNRA
ncbi:MAG: dihydroneopterin aldolase [Polaromonas sp.]